MTKINIDLGVATSFGVSASAAVTAGSNQVTNVGFDSATKFLLQCGWNLSALGISCSYSLKDWLITGKSYRTSGLLSKYATKCIDIGCKSFFAGSNKVNISSKDKLSCISTNAIKVRVSKSQKSTELAGDESEVLLLDERDCKVGQCDDTKILIGKEVGNQECVAINKDDGVSIFANKMQLTKTEVKIFDTAVIVSSSAVCWLNKSLIAKDDSAKMLTVHFQNGSVKIEGNANME